MSLPICAAMVAYGAPSAWGRMASTLKGTGTAVAWQIRPATAMPVNIGARSIMDCYISMRTRDTGFLSVWESGFS